jgi:phospholipid/cholesterol/gamma-HCH transport system substrate-binding protein/paraquat-inducible protein B
MSPSTEIKVGTFVIASAALILGGVIALGSGRFFHETQILETSTRESVDGLQVGSPVKYRGVPIGEVDTISFADRLYPGTDDNGSSEFDYGSPVVIRMKVRLDVFGPGKSEQFTKDIERGVAKGLRARMRSAGLTGGLFVELDMADAHEYPEIKPPFLPDYPYVPSAPSRFDEVLAMLERVSNSLGSVDFEGIGAGMKEAVDNLNRLLGGRVDTMLANADGFIAELGKSNAMLQRLLADPRLERTLDNASSMSADLRATLPAAVREYGEFGAELNTLLSGEEYELRRLLEALRQTAENLELLTDHAREDPPRLLFSAPPRKLAPGEIEP